MDYRDRRREIARRDAERAEAAEREHCAHYWAERAEARDDDVHVGRLSTAQLEQELAKARAHGDTLWAAACADELRVRRLQRRR